LSDNHHLQATMALESRDEQPNSPSLITRRSHRSLSVSSNKETALDVCYSVYGEATPAANDLDTLYEKNASMSYNQAHGD